MRWGRSLDQQRRLPETGGGQDPQSASQSTEEHSSSDSGRRIVVSLDGAKKTDGRPVERAQDLAGGAGDDDPDESSDRDHDWSNEELSEGWCVLGLGVPGPVALAWEGGGKELR